MGKGLVLKETGRGANPQQRLPAPDRFSLLIKKLKDAVNKNCFVWPMPQG